jgi:hypothetical protein
MHGETVKEAFSFSFGAPSVVREGVDQSQSGCHSPAPTALLLPVPLPPPALATEFIHALPSLHQIQEQISNLLVSDARAELWWGQCPWVSPIPPTPLPVPIHTPTPQRSQSPDPLVRFDESSAPPTLHPKSDSSNSHTSLPHVPPTDFHKLFDLASQF